MKLKIPIFCFFFLAGLLHAQAPVITSVTNESGSANLCPGGVAFVKGSNLGGTGTAVTVGTLQAYVFAAFGGAALQFEVPVNAPLGATTVTAGASASFKTTLTQYCPGIGTDGLADELTNASHYPSMSPVTASYPAAPNEQIAIPATGLGPTNPAFPTGTSPSNNSALTITAPTVSVENQSATVVSSFLSPNNYPGFYLVVFNVPANATTGNQNVTVSIGGLTSNTATFPISTGPIITGVVNAASGIPPGLPNYGIAQGAVFTAYGSKLGPSSLQIASLPLPTTAGLGGTVITVTVNGTTVTAPMLFTVAGQVAGVMPSNTPTGTGTMTLSFNGGSITVPITVVQSAFGISNTVVTSANNNLGIGATAVTVFGTNQTQVVTGTNTASPGDTLVMYGTGLGAALNGTAGDTAGATFGNIGTAPQVFVGGVQSPSVTYWGRSPGSVGLDQIVFTVPPNASLGCNVGIVVETMNGTTPMVSNGPTISLAAKDGATCSDPTQFISASLTGATSANVMFLALKQNTNISPNPNGTTTTTISSQAVAEFIQVTQGQIPPGSVTSANYEPSYGSCYTGFVYNSSFGNGNGLPGTFLNVGSSLTLTPPSGSPLTLPSVSQGIYASASGSTGFIGGSWGFSNGTGGPGLGPLSFNFPVPQQVKWTNQSAVLGATITRTSPLTITWTGGDANGYVDISGYGNDPTGVFQAGFECAAPTSAGQFTIPPSILLAIPNGAGAYAGITVATYALPASIGIVPGLNTVIDASQFQVSVPAIFK